MTPAADMQDDRPIAISISEAARMLGVSRPKMYEIAAREDFPAVRLGRRTLIHRQAMDDWLRKMCEGGDDVG